MSIASRVRPSYWAGRALDTYWRWQAAPSQPAPGGLTWPLRSDLLQETVITWPSTYGWAPFRNWGEQLRLGLAEFATTRLGDIPQPYKGVIGFRFTCRGTTFRINVEVSDYLELNEDAYNNADLHFKMQYRLEGYGARDRLLPGGYVNNHPDIYAFLPHLRRLRDTTLPIYDVHGRFGLSFETRRRALEILAGSSAFRFFGGQHKVRYGAFLREVARARICIDLPSYSPITFRLIDYLAIGTCIIGPPHTAQLHVPLEEGVHLAYCKPDYSDLEELCTYYLEHPEHRDRLVDNSRRFFDANLHRDQLAAYYLRKCLRLVG
jgi:hypothetical protein